MFIQSLKEDNNIINICICVVLVRLQNSIYLSLDIEQ